MKINKDKVIAMTKVIAVTLGIILVGVTLLITMVQALGGKLI